MKTKLSGIILLLMILAGSVTATDRFPANFTNAQTMVLENPSNAFFLSSLAFYYEKQDKLNQAIILYQRSLELEPESSEYYVKLARAYNRSGRPDLGKKVLTNAVVYFDHNPMVLSALADMDYDTGFFQSSISNYQKAMKFAEDKEKCFIYKGLGMAFRELKVWYRSDGYFLKSLELRQDIWTYYEYGKLLIDREDYTRAVWAFQKAKGLTIRDNAQYADLINKRLSSAYYGFGEKLKNNGHIDEARKIFKKITEDRELAKTDSCEKAAFWLKRL